MAKGARRLGHAEQKEQKYMELLAEQLGVITALVAKMDAITSSQRLEDAIDVKSDVTRDLSEKSSVKNQPIAEDGAKTSSTGNQVKNDSTAKSNVTNDLTGPMCYIRTQWCHTQFTQPEGQGAREIAGGRQ